MFSSLCKPKNKNGRETEPLLRKHVKVIDRYTFQGTTIDTITIAVNSVKRHTEK